MDYPAAAEEVWQLRHFGVAPTIENSTSIIRLLPDGQVSVGRGPKADFFLDSLIYVRLISRIHAVITGERLPNGHIRFTITNKGLNGTYINDFKLGVAENNFQVLHAGDKVAFGHVNCGSIKVGEYAPQPNSEFQFLFEKVKYIQEAPADQQEVAGTNPFFSPYPSETPAYSQNADSSVIPSDCEEHYNASSPRSTGNASEKENKMLKEGCAVHSFDSGDVFMEEKPTHLNLSAKFNKQLAKEEGEVVHKILESNFPQPHKTDEFDTYSIGKCSSLKTLLPDVIPDSVKGCGSSLCHQRSRKELMRSHSLPAHLLDDEQNSYSSPRTEKVKQKENSSGLPCVTEDNIVHTMPNNITYSNTHCSVNDIKSSPSPTSHMSKKKKYILSMANDDGHEASSNVAKSDKEIGDNSYVEVKTLTSLPQWDDLDCSRGKKGDGIHLKVEIKEEANVLLEKNKNNKGFDSHESSPCHAASQQFVKCKNDKVGDPLDSEQIQSASKSQREYKDVQNWSENYRTPVISLEKLPEDRKGCRKLTNSSVKVTSERKLKVDTQRVLLSSSEERTKQCPTSHRSFCSSSPIVIMEKIPDNIEGKLWTHLKSKENFSTKLKATSPLKSKSSKKHHHHSHHFHHHHHVDHNVQVKQKSSSTHLHGSIPSSHSSCSSKAFKSSHNSHKDSSSHIKHKKSKSHQNSQPAILSPVTTEQSKHSTTVSKYSSKTEHKDINFKHSDKIKTASSSEVSTPSCTPTNISVSKNAHSHSRSTQENKNQSSTPGRQRSKKVSSSVLPSQSIKNTDEEVIPTSFPKTRMLSTGFLSSDLNSDEEEERTRDDSPPNKKLDIVKRIYSPSKSPKPIEREDDKHHSLKNTIKDKKSKTGSASNVQASGVIDKPESSHSSKEVRRDDKIKNPDHPILNGSLHGDFQTSVNTNEIKMKKSDRKALQDNPSSKRRNDSPANKNKQESQKLSKVAPSSSSSSLPSCPASHNVKSSSTTKDVHNDKVNLSKSTRNEKHGLTHQSLSTANKPEINEQRSDSNFAMKQNPCLMNKTPEAAKQLNNKNSSSSLSHSKTEKLKDSRKMKSVESRDVELQEKTKSSAIPTNIDDGFTPNSTKEEKRQQKLPSDDLATLTSENSSKVSQQPDLKSSKKHPHNDGTPSTTTAQTLSNSLKKSAADRKQNLKRQKTVGDGVKADLPPKKSRESPTLFLQKKRRRLKNMSPSSSSSSSSSSDSSSSSSSITSSLLLFSEKFPPNKSKSVVCSNSDTTTKESFSKSKGPSMEKNSSMPKLSKSSSLSGKPSDSSRKSTSQSNSTEDVKKQQNSKPGLKRAMTSDDQRQEMFSLALEASESDRRKKKKPSKSLDKSNTTMPPKKVLKKQEVVNEKVEHSKDKNEDVDDNVRVVRRSNRAPPDVPTHPSRTRTSKRIISVSTKTGKRTTASSKVKKKMTSNWSSGSEEEDDGESSFDLSTVEDEEDWHLDDGVEYCNEPCGAKKCSNPVGPKVNWVMCDGCEGWFHVVCVNTTLEKIAENGDQFQCGFC